GLGHGLDVRRAHGDRHGLDFCAPLGPQGLEELFEDIGTLALSGPDDDAALVVDDDSDVLVVPTIGALVDADDPHVVQAIDIAALSTDDALNDLADGDPPDAHELRDRSLVVVLREIGRVQLKRPGESRAAFGPGHGLDLDAAAPAGNPPNAVSDPADHAAEVEVPPGPLARVIDRALALTVAAAGDFP